MPTRQWQLETEHAAWDERDSMGAAVFKNKIWIMGGWRPAKPLVNDVWSSADGRRWEKIAEHAPWKERNVACTLVHDDRLWVMGGRQNDSSGFSDVWCTADGEQWTCVCANAPWGPRTSAAAVSHQGKLWITGGFRHVNNHYCDVWCSKDGAHWEKVLDGAPWGKRGMHTLVVFNNQMVLIGGGQYHDIVDNYGDVWCSADGIHWEAKLHTSPWMPRRFAASTVCGNRIWLAAGWTSTGWKAEESCRDFNDVWSSRDGVDWLQVNRSSEYKWTRKEWVNYSNHWGTRHAPGMVTFQGKIWILGGGQRKWNDVWSLAME